MIMIMDAIALSVIALALLAAVLGSEARLSRLDKRLRRIEHKLDLLIGHLDVPTDDPALDEVAALARDGRTIEAIKKYRQLTGAGLSEAKEAVERMPTG
jgi:ribosomal protein L7/L12